AAAATRGRPRAQAGVLDPGRGMAPRGARALRTADSVCRHAHTAGLFPAGGREPTDRRPRRAPRGQQPAAVGPARVHALVRAPRRAGAAPSALGAHGLAARMTGRYLVPAHLRHASVTSYAGKAAPPSRSRDASMRVLSTGLWRFRP